MSTVIDSGGHWVDRVWALLMCPDHDLLVVARGQVEIEKAQRFQWV